MSTWEERMASQAKARAEANRERDDAEALSRWVAEHGDPPEGFVWAAPHMVLCLRCGPLELPEVPLPVVYAEYHAYYHDHPDEDAPLLATAN